MPQPEQVGAVCAFIKDLDPETDHDAALVRQAFIERGFAPEGTSRGNVRIAVIEKVSRHFRATTRKPGFLRHRPPSISIFSCW
jgi:hypothetical protein